MRKATRRKTDEAEDEAQEPSLGERRRQDLVEAAFTLIAEKGLEGLRTRDIAARAGVNISTLHYYFETKEALLVAVVQHVPQRFLAAPRRPRAPNAAWTLRSHLEEAWET